MFKPLQYGRFALAAFFVSPALAFPTYLAPPQSTGSADFDGDGFVSGDDYDAFIAAFKAGDLVADFDGDGFVSGDDYDAFIAAYEGVNPQYADLTPQPGSRVWHVSPRGNDANPGTREKPVLTLKKAASSLRDRFGDQALLERGGEWRESFGQIKAGGLPGAPLVIGAYGVGLRPKIITNVTAMYWSGGGGSPASISDVVISSLEIVSEGRVGNEECSAVSFLRPGARLTIEDCLFVGRSDALNLQGQVANELKDVTVYRSSIVGSFSSNAHSQGVYAENVIGITFEQSVLDHNGWSAQVAGAGPTQFNHNTYFSGNTRGVVFRNNISSRASSHGFSANYNAVATGNLFWRNPYHFIRTAGSVFTDNVVLESADIGIAPRGNGLVVGSVREGEPMAGPCLVARNIFAGKTAAGLNPAIMIGSNRDRFGATITLESNTFDEWAGGGVEVDPPGMDTVIQNGNVLDDARWNRPSRTLDQYARSIGLIDADDFVAAAARNERSTWREELTARAACRWFRAGYQSVTTTETK